MYILGAGWRDEATSRRTAQRSEFSFSRPKLIKVGPAVLGTKEQQFQAVLDKKMKFNSVPGARSRANHAPEQKLEFFSIKNAAGRQAI